MPTIDYCARQSVYCHKRQQRSTMCDTKTGCDSTYRVFIVFAVLLYAN